MSEVEVTGTIEEYDTVRLVGRKGKGVVVGLRPGGVQIEYTFNVKRYGQGCGYTASTKWFDADRVELVRKGNKENDAVDEMLALCDKWDTEKAAKLGLTLAEWRTAQDAEKAAAAAAQAAENARMAADRDARLAAEAAEAEAVAARAAEEDAAMVDTDPGHLDRHDGDVLAMLFCALGGAACPLNVPLES